MNLTIEKAQSRDLDAVAALYGAVCDYLADKPYNPGWRRDIFPAREDAEQYWAADGLYIVREGAGIIGSMALTPADGGILRIQEVAVHPDCQRQGVGSALLDFAVREAEKQGAAAIRLHVWEGNDPAIRAYERNGYVRLGKEDIGLSELGLNWFFLYEKRLNG